MKFLIFIMMIGLGCGVAGAASESTGVLPSAKWAGALTSQLPDVLCQPQGYYTTCYTIERSTCRDQVKQHVRECLGHLRLPAKVDPEDNGVSLSYQVGECIAKRLQKRWDAHYRPDPVCTMGAAWL